MSAADRFKAAIAAIVRELVPDFRFCTPVEYRVEKAEAGRFSARCTEAALGMPEIVDAPIRGSILGGHSSSKLTKGTTVLVMFVNGDPGRPFLIAGSDTTDPKEAAMVATTKAIVDAPIVELAGGGLGVARMGDSVVAGPFGGTITTASSRAKSG